MPTIHPTLVDAAEAADRVLAADPRLASVDVAIALTATRNSVYRVYRSGAVRRITNEAHGV